MINAFGIVTASNGRYHVQGMEDYRPIGAFSFLGRYRVVDFPVSNLSNSNIDRIQVYVSQNPRSLAEHLSYGQHYNINAKRGKLQLLFNQDSRVNAIYNTDVAAFMDNIEVIERMQQPYVVITPGNMIFKQDFQQLLQQHVDSGADVTLLYHKTDKADDWYQNCAVLDLNRQKGVKSIHLNDGSIPNRNIFMDTYVMKKEMLIKLIRDAKKHSSIFNLTDILNLEHDSLDIRGAQHKGSYMAAIYDLRSYFRANMELLHYDTAQQLFSSDWPIYTQTTDAIPVHYYEGARVVNSMVANGSSVYGTVENSVIGRGVEIKKGAVVKNCLILGHSVIGENVHLENQIVDKWAKIINVKELTAEPDYPGYVRRSDVL
ncbi:glucose-1-phosphate adenylyltransferase GlgD subunit [Firmicutes bacterium CAG:791]|nr:glucose-1-phosphate adenylyltransferase GlgD subunit [Firmicutes bacterium CAG:791]